MAANAKPIILAENIFNLGTPAATDTATGYDVLNILDRRPYTFWQAASFGTKYITINCGSAVTADALGIVGHNLFTCAATVSVEHSPDNASWTESLAGFTVTNNRAILKTFTSASKQYWRIKIVTAAIAPKIAVAFIGDRVEFPRTYSGNSKFCPAPQTVYAESARAKSGILLGTSLRYILIPFNLTVEYLTSSWVDNTFTPLWDSYLSQLYPVFVAWELTNHPNDIFFAKIPDGFKLQTFYDQMGNRTVSLDFEAVKE